MGELTGRVKPDQSQKIALIKGAIDSEVNWADLLDYHPLNKNPIVKNTAPIISMIILCRGYI